MSGSGVHPIGPLVLDSGGVIAYLDRDASVHRLCSRILLENYPVILPTAVYAQVERGTAPRLMQRQRLNALLSFCEYSPPSMEIATTPVFCSAWLVRAMSWMRSWSSKRYGAKARLF